MRLPLEEIYLYAKLIGALGSAAAVVYGAVKWLRATYHEVRKTNASVALLMTNHLPHIQSSLNEHTESLSILSSDVRDIGTKVDGMEQRLEDTKKGVHTLGESFLRHLENVSPEMSHKKHRRS